MKLCSERWWIALVFFTSLCTQARFCSWQGVELFEKIKQLSLSRHMPESLIWDLLNSA